MLKALQKEAETPGKTPTRPALDKRFLVDLKGKEFVTYAGLLDLAHQHGLTELKVEMVKLPTPDNGMECIVQATAVTESGALFCDLGDANPHNTSKSVAQHIIRMASTRAKARVLRDMTNIGITALEELGDMNGDVQGIRNGQTRSRTSKVPLDAGNGFARAISDAQKRAIRALARNRGIDDQALHEMAKDAFGCEIGALSGKNAADLILQLQAVN